MGLVLSDLIPMDQDWVWSGLVQPLKDPILLDLIGYQTRPDPIRSDSVGGPISISYITIIVWSMAVEDEHLFVW